MPFERATTTPKTGIALTAQYGVVTDWDLRGKQGIARIQLSWYASKAAFLAGYDATQVDEFPLTSGEQAVGKSQLIDVLYALIAARPEYSDVKAKVA